MMCKKMLDKCRTNVELFKDMFEYTKYTFFILNKNVLTDLGQIFNERKGCIERRLNI